MDHPKALFDGQKDVVILERAYHDVGGDLERAIDLVSHPDSGPSVTKAASLEPRLQRSRKRRRLSMSPAGMPPVAGHPQWTPALEQYERGKPRATPPSVEPVLPSTVDPKEELIVISDDEDSPTTLGNERPLGFDPMSPPAPAKSTQDECLSKALEVFPDISRDYVLKLYDEAADTPDLPEQLILQILDGGAKYPKETDSRKELKRKRQDDSDTVEINYEAADRGDATPLYTLQARVLLQVEFASIPIWYINNILRLKQHLFPAYLELEQVDRTYASYRVPPYSKLKSLRKPKDGRGVRPPHNTMAAQMLQHGDGRNKLLAELHAARARRRMDDLKRQAEADAQVAATLNEKEHKETGMMMECQCCFSEYPFDSMTHCDGDDCHFFCLDCAKRNADNEIGQSRYKLRCMDGSGCSAEFSRQQTQRFLDDKTLAALARIQQDEEIRMAELDGLAKCPFCDFAAICPPVEVDREFRCRNLECERVSCRLCRQETHIPLSCEDFAKENKATIRHAVEEAMTEALVRSCNKCQNKYIKENGCNKMMCTRCHSVQCYVCSKTITNGYGHFDDTHRGGGKGNCPLFDNTDQRHEDEVKNAEKAALAKIRAENPDIADDDLKIQLSETVKRDERKRLQAAAARPHPMPGWARRPPLPPILVYQPANFNAAQANFNAAQANAVGQAPPQFQPAWPPEWFQGAAYLNQVQNQIYNPFPAHAAGAVPAPALAPAPPHAPAQAPAQAQAPAPYDLPVYVQRYIPPAIPSPPHEHPHRRRTVLLGDRVVAVPPPPPTPPPNRAHHPDVPRQVDAIANAVRQQEMMARLQAAHIHRYDHNQPLELVQRHHMA